MDKVDIEAGMKLYPSMIKSPELRRRFIRKVYIIISLQLLFTAVFAFAFFFICFPLVRNCVLHHDYRAALVLFGPIIFTVTLSFVLSAYYDKHPVNIFLLGFYTLGVSAAVGITCAFAKARATAMVDLETLPNLVVGCLMLFTFVAVKVKINFLEVFLSASLAVILLFGDIQVFFSLGPIASMVFVGLDVLITCGFIVHDTCDLIKRYNYHEYIWVVILIYVDIVSLFVNLLSIWKFKP